MCWVRAGKTRSSLSEVTKTVMNPAEKSVNFVFKRFAPSDLPAMAALHASEYGSDVREQEREFHWLMCENPTGPGQASLAFLPDGQLVGTVLNVPLPFARDDERFTGCMTVSVLSRPDQRGKGLFTRQAKMVCDNSLSSGHKLVIGFPNENAKPGWRKLGHTFVGGCPQANRPLLLLKWVANRVRIPRVLLSVDGLVSSLATPRRRVPFAIIDGSVGLHFEPLMEPGRISLYTDTRWLQWRYLSGPRRYAMLAVGPLSRPDAVAIVRVSHNRAADGTEVPYGLIMDAIVADHADDSARDNVVLAALRYLKERGCHSVKAMVSPRTAYADALTRLRFHYQKRSDTPFIIRSAPGFSAPSDLSGYAITNSWVDWV